MVLISIHNTNHDYNYQTIIVVINICNIVIISLVYKIFD
jgi:hypothetical protein